ncbi:hypothetical protein PILCRDRAFT_11564, partial [Piloderma croceum F 1598]
CWHVEKDGQEYVIKDSWIHEGRTSSEIDVLKYIANIQGVPTLIAGEDVTYPGVLTDNCNSTIIDSTKLCRVGLDYEEARLHRRILMQPVGESIVFFATKKELIGVFLDVVQTHKDLCEKKRILHRDISKNNIFMWRDPGFQLHRRGLVIDYDYAERLDEKKNISIGSRTGTGPFMAIEVLDTAGIEQIVQKPVHDIESIFYVLLHICILFNGPGNMKRTNGDLEQYSSVAISSWFQMYARFRELADRKRGQLANFEKRFLTRFSPYFHDLRPCVTSLWNILFPPIVSTNGKDALRDFTSCAATHNEVLEVLRLTYEKLPLQDAPIELASAPSKKATKRNADDSDRLTTRVTKKRTTDGEADRRPGSSGARKEIRRSVSAMDTRGAGAHRSDAPGMSRRSVSAMTAAQADPRNNSSQIVDSGIHLGTGSSHAHVMTLRSDTKAANTSGKRK